jgi:hypothetical protein
VNSQKLLLARDVVVLGLSLVVLYVMDATGLDMFDGRGDVLLGAFLVMLAVDSCGRGLTTRGCSTWV